MQHKIVVDESCWSKGVKCVSQFHLEPPLPKDEFSYVIKKWEDGVVETSSPYMIETEVELEVSLDTAVFVKQIKRDSHRRYASGKIPCPVKKLLVTARVRALRHGGSLYSYGGFIDQNPPRNLPLEVLEWKINLDFRSICFESGKNAYQKTDERKIIPVPNSQELYASENKRYPWEPQLNLSLERFFFKHWLADRTLTLEAATSLYQTEVLAPYQQALADYREAVDQANRFYYEWLEKNDILLLTVEEMWDYLQNEALPQAARRTEENSRKILKEAGHPEWLELFASKY